ncbi:MAG TPA: asparaginase domain-containing protein [Iamia sp.]|jgi:L-asparaginase|nr:asparaginase domain-containing protein [Iamia sp.]
MTTTRRILCLRTGGTIEGGGEAAGGHVDAEALTRALDRACEHIAEAWDIEVEHRMEKVDDLDSTDVEPELWTKLAKIIHRAYDDHDAFLVVHGTNTMGYTAAALSFAIANSKKPIVITGSQIPIGGPSSDALANVENAVRVCVYPYQEIGGVVCLFGSRLITGTRVKKSSDFDIDAFAASPTGTLGRLGRFLDVDRGNLARHQGYLGGDSGLGISQATLQVVPDFDLTGVLSLTEFPGLDPDLLRRIVDAAQAEGPGLRGVVLRAFGAGDVGRRRRPLLERLRALDVPVVVTTQVPTGTATLDVNRPGKEVRDLGLGVAAHDMSIESITTKLGWLIAQGHGSAEIRRLMAADLRGEIQAKPNVRW